MEVSVPPDNSDIADPPVTLPHAPRDSGMRPSNVHWDSSIPSDPSPPVISHIPLEKTSPLTQPSHRPPKIIEPLDRRHRSPPPVLLSSIVEDSSLNVASPNPEHSKIVGQVTAALDDGSMEEDSKYDDEASEDSDAQMSEEEEPDDLMTLNQYQEEARRVALICKGTLLDVEFLKKGRLEKGESSHP